MNWGGVQNETIFLQQAYCQQRKLNLLDYPYFTGLRTRIKTNAANLVNPISGKNT